MFHNHQPLPLRHLTLPVLLLCCTTLSRGGVGGSGGQRSAVGCDSRVLLVRPRPLQLLQVLVQETATGSVPLQHPGALLLVLPSEHVLPGRARVGERGADGCALSVHRSLQTLQRSQRELSFFRLLTGRNFGSVFPCLCALLRHKQKRRRHFRFRCDRPERTRCVGFGHSGSAHLQTGLRVLPAAPHGEGREGEDPHRARHDQSQQEDQGVRPRRQCLPQTDSQTDEHSQVQQPSQRSGNR